LYNSENYLLIEEVVILGYPHHGVTKVYIRLSAPRSAKGTGTLSIQVKQLHLVEDGKPIGILLIATGELQATQ
jgi:hypothetical protein